MLIYLCLSSHGYGHAARQAAVLIELHRLQPQWRFVVSTDVDFQFLSLALQGVPFEHRKLRWDVGMVQANALAIDQMATLKALQELEQHIPAQIAAEVSWIQSQQMSVLVLADIPPAAAELADQLGVPLVWMGNFGWDEIYAPLGDSFLTHAEAASAEYSRGKKLLRCPFSLAMDWGLPEQSLGLTASSPRSLPLGLQQKLESFQGPIVMVGFGGLGLALDSDLFQRWPDHLFLMPKPRSVDPFLSMQSPDNVLYLPRSIRVVDALPYCSRHLGKPGYSSFCEAISLGIGLHVVLREGFAESVALINGLQSHAAHRLLEREALELGEWELDQPLIPASQQPLAVDGSMAAASAVVELVS
ncbi:hypothetical protein [Prochlorococcus marinus]|uniref:hypothetical protein n=1 Tax=Prochlorococcus TaxID=1218 RepID=UPI0007B37EF0|nr:hypothetical protein [Prochlorococcus marinus]KZR75411.1 hypothetical protein PMIT1323_01701 [Prochlorococcus marinus str. MIT 1323]